MPKILNPFASRGRDPVANALTELGKNFFGGSLDREINTEKLVALQRGNQETENLMGLTADDGAASLASSPIAQAMMIGAGYDPTDFGKMGLLETATTQGAKAPMTQNFQVGTGQPYDNTAGAFDARLGETRRANDLASSDNRYRVDNALVEAIVNGQPQYMRNTEAPGAMPVLSNTEVQGTQALNNFGNMGALPIEEQTYLGADPTATTRTPRNYVSPDGQRHITYDGVNDAQTQQPLPPGGYIAGVEGGAEDALGANALTTQSTNDLQGTIRRVDEYAALSTELRTLAQTKPEAFGLLGNLRGNLQEAVQVVPALQALFGGEDLNAAANGMLQSFSQKPEAAGMFAELASTYDGDLPTVRTLGVMLKYQLIAAALGQNGRDLSDKDLVQGDKMFPDPQGIFSSAQSVISTLNLFDRLMANKKAAAVQQLNTGSVQPGGATTPQPAPAGATEQANEGDIVAGPDGKTYVVQNGQLVPQ